MVQKEQKDIVCNSDNNRCNFAICWHHDSKYTFGSDRDFYRVGIHIPQVIAMDRLELQKNILDIRERNYRLYFTTQLFSGLTLLSIYTALLNIVPATSNYYPIYQLFGWFSLFVFITSFEHNYRADEVLEEIKALLPPEKTKR